MRSAAAEAFLRQSLTDAGVEDVAVRSAGTRTRHGRAADDRVRARVDQYGASVDAHQSRPLTRELVDWADAIFVMDDMNYADVRTDYPHASYKVFFLGGLDKVVSDRSYHAHEIADPFGASSDGVAATIDELRRCVLALSRVIRG